MIDMSLFISLPLFGHLKIKKNIKIILPCLLLISSIIVSYKFHTYIIIKVKNIQILMQREQGYY